MNPVLIVFILSALIVLGGSVWLFNRAGEQARGEDLKLRLRVTGTEDTGFAPAAADISNPVIRGICHLFWRTGRDVKPGSVIRALIALVAAAVAVGVVRGAIIAVAALAIVLLLIYIVLISRASRRRIRIVEQLPGYLEGVIRVLAAGNTLEESLGQASRESPDPIKPLFASISRQVRLGAQLDQVLVTSGGIYRLRDLRVMALAAGINRKFGGSMRGVLKSLIVVIRQRASAAQELRALTAETRFSAFILAGITVGLFAFLYLSNRSYYAAMAADGTGRYLLYGSAGMVAAGFFVLWRMLKGIDEGDS